MEWLELFDRLFATAIPNVEEIEVVKSLGNTGCDEAAVKAIKQWRFAPAVRQGRPIAARVTMPVLFNLKTAQ